MKPISTFKTPGQLVNSLLDARGWSKRVLAVVLGLDETVINKLASDKRKVTADLALGLEEAFGVKAELFLELQQEYDLAVARITAMPDPGRSTRAQLFSDLPISKMMQRGWLEAGSIKDVPAVEASLAQFFGVRHISEIETLPHAAKKTNVAQDVTPAQLAWLYRVKSIASEMLTPRFSASTAMLAVEKLESLREHAEEIRKVPRVLAESGIRFVIVESIGSAKIDGACFWLASDAPVIGMTLRYDRIDNFWFVLRHELEHVCREHGKSSPVLDAELEGDRAGLSDNVSEEERVANLAGAEFCTPAKKLAGFIARKSPSFTDRDLVGFARTLRLHPGLVAGQLRKATDKYNIFGDYLVRVRETVSAGAVVDGWGSIAPVGRS